MYIYTTINNYIDEINYRLIYYSKYLDKSGFYIIDLSPTNLQFYDYNESEKYFNSLDIYFNMKLLPNKHLILKIDKDNQDDISKAYNLLYFSKIFSKELSKEYFYFYYGINRDKLLSIDNLNKVITEFDIVFDRNDNISNHSNYLYKLLNTIDIKNWKSLFFNIYFKYIPIIKYFIDISNNNVGNIIEKGKYNLEDYYSIENYNLIDENDILNDKSNNFKDYKLTTIQKEYIDLNKISQIYYNLDHHYIPNEKSEKIEDNESFLYFVTTLNYFIEHSVLLKTKSISYLVFDIFSKQIMLFIDQLKEHLFFTKNSATIKHRFISSFKFLFTIGITMLNIIDLFGNTKQIVTILYDNILEDNDSAIDYIDFSINIKEVLFGGILDTYYIFHDERNTSKFNIKLSLINTEYNNNLYNILSYLNSKELAIFEKECELIQKNILKYKIN